jgi:hypothetical protein
LRVSFGRRLTAKQIALQKRSARSEEVSDLKLQFERSTAALKPILDEFTLASGL